MDISTILGVSLGILIMVAAIVLGGAPFAIFVDYPALLCVFGGATAAVLICYPLRAMKMLPVAILKTVLVKTPPTGDIVAQIVALAEIARRDGLLALEHGLEEVSHPFLKLGVQMAIDGTKPHVIDEVLRNEIHAISTRHSLCKGVMDQLGKYAPAFGMIGTMFGLVMMLNNMSDPSAIGSGMAVALLTTLYGAVLANLFCLPMSEKLSYYHREEVYSLELIIKGVLALQSGENPRVIEHKLQTVLLPPTLPAKGSLSMTQDDGGGTPGWFVTFSDMLSLLLTFFIMLVSLSELKSEEKYQALLDGFQTKFGSAEGPTHVLPGEMRPRNSQLSKLASAARLQRQAVTPRLSQLSTPQGDRNDLLGITATPKTVLGTVLYFQEDQIELNDDQRSLLRQLADVLRSSPQRVEIRGHTTDRLSPSENPVRDNWDLSFERCRRVMQYLVEEQQVNSRTLRISASAANEPLASKAVNLELTRDSRVEVYLLNEAVPDTTSN